MEMTPHRGDEESGLGREAFDASTRIAEARVDPRAQEKLDRAHRRGPLFWLLMFIVVFFIAEQTSLSYALYSYALGEFAVLYPGENVVWILSANALGGAVFLPLLTKLADVYGKKRVLIATTFLVAIGAAVCAVAPNFGILIAGRVLMSASIGLVTISMTLIREVFPPRYRALSMGIIATGGGLFVIVGPLLSSLIVSMWSMSAVFVFQLFTVLAAGTATLLFLPDSPTTILSRVDYLGAILLGTAAFCIIGGTSFIPTVGVDALVIVLVVGGVVAATLFAVHLRRAEEPLVSIESLRRKETAAPILAFGVLGASVAIVLPLVVLQWSTPIDVAPYGRGLDQAQIALWSIPYSVVSILAGFFVGKTVRTIGYRMNLFLGCAAAATSAALLALFPTADAGVTIALYALGGLFALASAASVPLVLLSVPEDQRTVALGINVTFSNVLIAGFGQIGYAILGLTAGGAVGTVLYTTGGYQLAYAVAAALAVVAAALALRVPHGRPDLTRSRLLSTVRR